MKLISTIDISRRYINNLKHKHFCMMMYMFTGISVAFERSNYFEGHGHVMRIILSRAIYETHQNLFANNGKGILVHNVRRMNNAPLKVGVNT